jgi:CO/xanthine dehydrogenase Mo-binding subunit
MTEEIPAWPVWLPRTTRRLDGWLTLAPPGYVTVRTGKVELGQGVRTALAQIAADELRLGLDQVEMSPVDTAESPDEGWTAGSVTIEVTGTLLARVCATARERLRDRAAGALGVDAGALVLSRGTFSDPRTGATTSYWDADLQPALAAELSDDVETLTVAERRAVGTSVPRLDIPAKVRGEPVFVHDVELPELLHARVVRPPRPGAALEVLGRLGTGDEGVVVVRDGDFVAVVHAREEHAVRAADRLRATSRWRTGDPLPEPAQLADFLCSEPLEHEDVAERDGPSVPVARTVRHEYQRPFAASASIGPACALARWTQDVLEVWAPTQSVYNLRAELADTLGIDAAQVVVRHVDGPGCYGHNGTDDAAFEAALVSRHLDGRCVRLQWSREEEFALAPFGAAMVVAIEADLDAGGSIVEWRHDVWSNGHVSRPGMGGAHPIFVACRSIEASTPAPVAWDVGPPGIAGITRNAIPMYEFPRQRVRSHRKLEMPLRTSSLRSLGAYGNVFAIESMLDEIALATGRDPVDLRLDHLVDERARKVLERAATAASWDPSAARGEGWGRGIGFARYKGTGGYAAVVAEVEVVEDVRVRRLTIVADVGSVVNPDGLRNQLEGGAVQATSWTLLEAVPFDREQVLAADWLTYPILRCADAPALDVIVVDRPDQPPLGAGEIVQGPTGAAIANALAHALDVRVRALPLTRARVIEAIETSDTADAVAANTDD